MYFTIEKIENQLREIRQAIYREICDLNTFKFLEGEWSEMEPWMVSGLECPEYDDSKWDNFQVGQFWGGYDYLAWFRAWVQIPPTWQDKKLALHFLVGPRDGGGSTAEALLYVNGKPLQAVDVWHEEAWLPPEVVRQGQFHVALRSWSGVLNVPSRRHFKLAQLVWIDEPTQDFYSLCDTVLKAVKVLNEMDLRRVKGLQLLNAAFLSIDFTIPGSPAFYASIDIANQYLQAGVASLQSLREIKPRVIGIGHAHIDLAWLWRLRHTREKASRTFATALHLMRQYPEYHFLHSSPQLYKYLKEDYPQIFEQIKERIAAGQWEINGGMWVEADTNLASGEALIRQFLFGKRFARAEFGVDMNILWLPDVFGYSAALPQIAKGCGIEYFLTTKISWSQFNRFPYDTFNWRGIDGTELLTYFVTTPENNSSFYTYNGQVQPEEVKGIWDQYQQKNENDELLMLYGWGDGGGGPTREMLESARGLKNFPGLPEVELGRAEDFFTRLGQRLQGKSLPVWDGELYLEYHRGTYTSQAQNKRFNRKAEILFQQAEWLSAIADIITKQDCYPVQALKRGWELILLNQFHDILPGSSIRQVYEDCYQDYQTIFTIGEQAVAQARQALAHQINPGKDLLVIFNSLPWRLDSLVEIPWNDDLESKEIQDVHGNSLPVQILESGEERRLLVEVSGIPSLGYQAYPVFAQDPALALASVGGMQTFQGGQRRESEISHKPSKKVASELHNVKNTFQDSEKQIVFQSAPLRPAPAHRRSKNDISVQPDLLENSYFRITLNQSGQITSLWDKQNQREVLASGQLGNVFQVFEDKPMNFDAWDIDIYYQEKMRTVDNLLEAVVEEIGPLRGVLRLRWRIYDSTITQWLTVYKNSHRIDFRTQVDWKEHQVLLKVAFPVGLRSTRATYDIQFGNLERPTHQNTSWDTARFEMVGHKWADLSEGNYGVSLLNDCKYGYDVKDNVLRLTLIKSPIHPDPQADQGQHNFTYSLLTHHGEWRNSDLVQEAYELNNPLNATFVSASQGKSSVNLPSSYQFAEIDCDDVILETVKKAENEQAWIVRVYEYKQYHRNQVNILFGQPILKAVACNMIEEDERPVEYDGFRLSFPIAPYEIKTFKIWF